MKNAYFDDDDLSVMKSSSQLHIVSSFISEIQPIKPDKKYRTWINHNSAPHQHKEMMLVLSGTGYFTLNGLTYPCSPGTFFLIDSNEPHDFYYPPFFDNFRHLWIRIVNQTILTGTPYQKMNGTAGNARTFNYTFNEYNPAGRLLINAWDELARNTSADPEFKLLYVKHAASGLLLELCRAGYELSSGAPRTEEHHKSVINAIAGHIKETGGKNLDIDKLAHIAGYSKFHFARMFKSVTGLSVLNFINLSRMDKFKELSAAGLNKKQISEELGFSCPAAFSRWLKGNTSN